MDILDKLRYLSDWISNNESYHIAHVNSGGCGAFALMIYNHLIKLSEISNIEIIIIDYEYDKPPQIYNLNDIRLLNNNFISDNIITSMTEVGDFSWSHILIKFKYNQNTYYYDGIHSVMPEDFFLSDENQNYGKFVIFDGNLKIEELRNWVKNKKFWNKAFKFSAISKIKNFAKVIL